MQALQWNRSPAIVAAKDYGIWKLGLQLMLAAPTAKFIHICWRWLKWKLRLSPLFGLPGPTDGATSFLLGQFLTFRAEPFLVPHKRWIKKAIEAQAKKTGKDFRAASADVKMIHYTSFFGMSSLIVLDPHDVQNILVKPYGSTKSPFYRDARFLRPTIGDGLLTLAGPEWLRHRHIAQPAFAPDVVQSGLSSSVPKRVQKLTELWKRAGSTREVDVASHFSALTLDIIGDVAFSHQFDGLDSVEEWVEHSGGDDDGKTGVVKDPLIQAFTKSFEFSTLVTLFFVTGMDFLVYARPKTRVVRRCLREAVDDIISKARDDLQNSAEGDQQLRAKSLLHELLKAQMIEDKKLKGKGGSRYKPNSMSLTDEELRDEIKTFIAAGHETTSTWCYWIAFALVQNPEIQKRVYDDIMKHADTNGEITLDAVEKMEFYNAFLMEVLRLYPPVGFVLRFNRKKETIGGQIVPPKTRLHVPVHLLHRHPYYWDEPEEFRPERWIDCKKDNELGVPYKHRFAFIPFSGGARNCIGQRFSTVEVKLIMAPLIRDFVFSLAPSQKDVEFTFTTFVTMKSKPGLKICLATREK